MEAILQLHTHNKGSRLLHKLRDTLALAVISAQEKLDLIVTFIASEMNADVCSIYLLRSGTYLELFSTYGLNDGFIHTTRLKKGEGVVGEVAASGRLLVLSDAKQHKNFRLIEGIGEESLCGFVGVPISRSGRILGVLVVQTRDKRFFRHDEVETLQTISMILAEIVGSGAVISLNELMSSEGVDALSLRFKGITLNQGLASGQAVLHHSTHIVRQFIADNVDNELLRFEEAVNDMHGSLKKLLESSSYILSQDERAILQAYELFARDHGWLDEIKSAIKTGLTAEASVQKVFSKIKLTFLSSQDAYVQAKLWDFEDLTHRLLKHLKKDISFAETASHLSQGIIVVARRMGPAELLEYEKNHVLGLVLEEGLDTAHVSVIARALDIPVISHVPGILRRIDQGEMILMDGEAGQVIIHPSEEDLEHFKKKQVRLQEKCVRAEEIRDFPTESLDAQLVQLSMNAGLLSDLRFVDLLNVDTIGLYRTEIPFMMASTYPDVTIQEKIYGDVLSIAKGRPIYFRTLDIGGDKVLPYYNAFMEENPLMGWRAIRIGLDRPALLRQQLNALLRAAKDETLYVMFPMVTEPWEFFEARSLVFEELERLKSKGIQVPLHIKVGMMIETPSIILSLERIIKVVDFISVGSNDLFQFSYAVDRGNPHLLGKYDPLSPVFLKILKRIIDLAEQHKVPLSICGEMASEPLDAMVLLGLGFKSLSVAASSYNRVKKMIRTLDVSQMQEFVQYLMTLDLKNIRPQISNYAKDHNIYI